MTRITNDTIITAISKENTGIRTGIIENTKIGMVLLVDEQKEDEPIQQLQFNSKSDLEHFMEKLNELKKQMEVGE